MSTDFRGADDKLSSIKSKFLDVDPDLRFMALIELNKLLAEHSLIISNVKTYSKDIIAILLKALKDPNADVRNQALRCFHPLVGSLSDDDIKTVLHKLNGEHTATNSITTSLHTMAITEVLKNLNLKHASTGALIIADLLPSLIGSAGLVDTLDGIETMTEMIKNLGTAIPVTQLELISTSLVKTVFRGESIIAKKAIIALGCLAPNLSQREFEGLLRLIDTEMTQSYESITLGLLTYISLAKSTLSRFEPYLEQLLEFSVKHLYINDDELDDEQVKIDDVRYESLLLIDSLLSIGPAASVYVDQVLEIIQRFLSYDPYTNDMDDDDDEDDLSDTGYSDDEEYDDYDDNSDDNTWKLRKQASKLTSTIVTTFPGALIKVFSSGIFTAILKRVSDSSDAVAFENITTLNVIVQSSLKATGKRSSRKRRGSDVVMSDFEDAVSYLSKFRSDIVAKFTSELASVKDNSSNKYNTLLNFFQSFTRLGDDLVPLLASVREHNFGLNLDLLNFYSAMLRNNELRSFGSEFDYIVSMINSGLTSKNHISITNSITTAIDLLNLAYNDTLTDSIISIASVSKNDSGIRNAAIEAIGEIKTLPPNKVAEIMVLFAATLKYEPIVSKTILSITTIAQTYGSQINTPSLSSIIETYQILLSNQTFFADLIDSLIAISAVAPIDPSVGQFLDVNSRQLTNQSQIVKILANMGYEKSRLTLIYSGASGLVDVDESALLDAGIKIGSCLIPTLEKKGDSVFHIKVLAKIVVNEGLKGYVAQREQELLARKNLAFNFKFLGYVGEDMPLSIGVDHLVGFFQDEENKIYAAETLGKLACQNPQLYVPQFLQTIQAGEDRYLWLVALKQVLAHGKDFTHDLYDQAWETLVTLTQAQEFIDDLYSKIISQNLGMILVKNSETMFFYSKGSDLLSAATSPVTLYAMIAAVKFILAYDDIISVDVVESLLLSAFGHISNETLEVKQIAMITLMTALNNQFTGLIPYLPQILPKVYEELAARKEYQETIQIGPFKHKIDKALEVRKNAFEILYKLTLNRVVLKDVDFNEVLSKVIENGLKSDIISISSLVITKLLEFDDVVLSDQNKEMLSTGIDKLLINIKKKEDQGKDTKEEQETKATLTTLKRAVFPVDV